MSSEPASYLLNLATRDLDALCVQDYKFTPGTPVDFLEDRFGLTFWPAMVTVDLDEIVSIRFQNEQG